VEFFKEFCSWYSRDMRELERRLVTYGGTELVSIGLDPFVGDLLKPERIETWPASERLYRMERNEALPVGFLRHLHYNAD
jgi:hypothetical protein